VILSLAPLQPVVAQGNDASETCETPSVTVAIAQKQRQPRGNNLAGDEMAQPAALVPSLWWAKEQFDPFDGQLIATWIAHPQHRQIDLIVNRQLWSRLDYVKRYRFVNQFGTVVRNAQYNLSVFNQQQKCLATYTCTYQTDPYQCHINLDPLERSGFLLAPLSDR
jgi:hypothetical protein